MKVSTLIWSGALLLCAAGASFASPPAGVQTRETQAATTPAGALALLEAGNARFLAGTPRHRDSAQQVRLTSSGQYPFAAVLGCIDSRVAPEIVFDTGIGDVFSARIAGNALDDELLGSLEFAIKVAGAKAIVVLGHTHCGAIKGACDGVQLGHLSETLSLLRPALEAARDVPVPHDSTNAGYVQQVTEENARLTAKAILARSEILRGLAEQGKLAVVAAIYDVSDRRSQLPRLGRGSTTMGEILRQNLLSPIALAFALGVFAKLIRSEFPLPKDIYIGISIYLLLALGLHGGTELAHASLATILWPALVTVLLGVITPSTSYLVLRSIGRFGMQDSAGIAAHYGSVSAVTFIAAQQFVQAMGAEPEALHADAAHLAREPRHPHRPRDRRDPGRAQAAGRCARPCTRC